MRIGKSLNSLGDLWSLILIYGKFVGFERLFGSRRSLVTLSDDGYVGDDRGRKD